MEGISIISKELIAEYVPSNPNILEAGAHIGRDTVKLSRFWPEGYIYAFEPVPGLFRQLKEATKDLKNVTCYQYALDIETGMSDMYISEPPFSASSSLLEPTGYLEEHPEATFKISTVETITIDSWAKKNSVDHIDFMWLDMQGAELRALEGGKELLKTVKVIQSEVSLTARYQNGPLYKDVRKWLENHGFNVVEEALHKGHWGNVLFARP